MNDDTTTLLPGEGETEIITRKRMRKPCEQCGEDAHYCLTYLLHNARSNPRSKGYGRDDISYCSDFDVFVCEAHKDETTAPNGYSWCSRFEVGTFPGRFLEWVTVKTEKVTK